MTKDIQQTPVSKANGIRPPFQGSWGLRVAFPRALPWADMGRPVGASGAWAVGGSEGSWIGGSNESVIRNQVTSLQVSLPHGGSPHVASPSVTIRPAFQGSWDLRFAIPRALPWVGMGRPVGASDAWVIGAPDGWWIGGGQMSYQLAMHYRIAPDGWWIGGGKWVGDLGFQYYHHLQRKLRPISSSTNGAT